MPFWRCYYHLTWATKYRQPLISEDVGALIYSQIRHISADMRVTVFAVNGMPDHIHVAASIPPSLSIAEWVKRCKGSSSHSVNYTFTDSERFSWQTGYGVLTFGYKQLGTVVSYIDRQKQHHADGTTQSYMEQAES